MKECQTKVSVPEDIMTKKKSPKASMPETLPLIFDVAPSRIELLSKV